MNNLSARSDKKELLDADGIPFDDIKKNMQELNTINTLLGGHAITLKGFKQLAGHAASISICEIGCGGGDNLAVIHRYCSKKNISLGITGIDIKDSCIAYAKESNAMPANWICSDYKEADLSRHPPDIIFSSLFCHHFTETELITMLQWMNTNCRKGWFINDLHRHPLAYYAIKIITRLFSRSYLVKHDAPLSVARGFTKKEWKQLLLKAGISNSRVSWQWAFRHLVIYKK